MKMMDTGLGLEEEGGGWRQARVRLDHRRTREPTGEFCNVQFHQVDGIDGRGHPCQS